MMRFTKVRIRRGSIAVIALSAAACADLLGIDEARIDPSLTTGMTGGSTLDAGGLGGAGNGGGAGSGGTTPADTGAPETDAGGGGSTVDAGGWDVPSDNNDSAICRQYCSDIMDYCQGDLKQYVDMAQCLKVCAIYPEGTITDADGNTASCRLKYAGKARYALGTERDAYCRKAGPGSEGTCGAICDGFCLLMMATCTPKFAPYNYPSPNDCITACRALKDAPPYTVSDGTLPDRNDAQCRLFHVCSAVMDPDEHCEHAMGVTMCDPKGDAGRD